MRNRALRALRAVKGDRSIPWIKPGAERNSSGIRRNGEVIRFERTVTSAAPPGLGCGEKRQASPLLTRGWPCCRQNRLADRTQSGDCASLRRRTPRRFARSKRTPVPRPGLGLKSVRLRRFSPSTAQENCIRLAGAACCGWSSTQPRSLLRRAHGSAVPQAQRRAAGNASCANERVSTEAKPPAGAGGIAGTTLTLCGRSRAR